MAPIDDAALEPGARMVEPVKELTPQELEAYARGVWAPKRDAFLESVIRRAIEGGRNSDVPTKIVAQVLLGVGSGDVNNFFLGVPVDKAKRMLEEAKEAERMDVHQTAVVAARYLAGYLEVNGDQRDRILELVLGKGAVT